MTAVRGFRIVHDTARWPAVVVVPDMTRPFEKPARCPSCLTAHPVKTYHISVNDVGAAIVSPGVLEGLKRAGMGGFRVETGVPDPPKQVLGGSGGKFVEVPQRERMIVYHA